MFKIFSRSLPTALIVVFNVVLVSAFSSVFNLSYELQSSISVILTTISGLYYLLKICRPLNIYRGTLFFAMLLGFSYCVLFQPEFFNIVPLDKVSILIIFVLAIDSFYIYKVLNYVITYIFHKFDNTIEIESNIYKINK